MTFIGIGEPRISTMEFRAFCTECNIYREIKDFRKSKFIVINILTFDEDLFYSMSYAILD